MRLLIEKMPAALAMKPEINKINNQEGSDLPIRQAIIIIEHKIRNLEKRKVRNVISFLL